MKSKKGSSKQAKKKWTKQLTSILFSALSPDKQYPKSSKFPSNDKLKFGSTPTPLKTKFKLDLLINKKFINNNKSLINITINKIMN